MKNGTILNNTYRVLHPIAMGGLGEIYLGYHENLHTYVVIKKVKDHCVSLMNNRTEVDILKELRHTYLPRVYDFIQLEDGIFTVMEYIQGQDLKHYMDSGYRFKEDQLILWMKQLCQVLDYLHNRKTPVIHCDIKPANIMITDEGNICLIDFNISLDGENNKDLVGLSSAYASPEQVKKARYKELYGSGEKVKMDERTDIYSTGAVFYEMMSGICPNAKDKDRLKLCEMELPYSDSLANIVDKAMHYDSGRRFRSAAKMLEALEHQEKWATRYLKLWKTGILLDTAVVILCLALACPMVLGYRGMKTEEFFYAYDTYIELVKEWMEVTDGYIRSEDTQGDELAESVIEKGIQLLNNGKLAKKLQQHPSEKTEILYRIGQASLYLGDYQQAEEYLEEALDCNGERAEIYRDLAIAQAKEGRIRSAEKSLKEAVDLGLSDSEDKLLMAEISLAKEDYHSAWEYVTQAAVSKEDEVAEQAAYYVLEISQKLGNTSECIAFVKQLEQRSSGAMKYLWLRKQAQLCFDSYSNGSQQYLKDAVSCYVEIYQNGYAQLEDLYNLVTCYMEQGQLRAADSMLKQMETDYPNEYKIPMRLAYVSYRIQNDAKASQRDYRLVERYFQKACEICQEKNFRWQDDVNMLQLEEIIRQLQEQGWL